MAVNDEFVRETATQIRDLSDGLIALEQSPDDGETLDATFRTAHSLKGNCSMEGLDDASALAHAVEDLLSAVREGALEPESDIVDEALAAVDIIETLVEAAAADESHDAPAEATADALRAMVEARRDDSAAGYSPAASSGADDEIDTSGFDPEVQAALEGASEYDDLDALLAQMEDPADSEDPFDGEPASADAPPSAEGPSGASPATDSGAASAGPDSPADAPADGPADGPTDASRDAGTGVGAGAVGDAAPSDADGLLPDTGDGTEASGVGDDADDLLSGIDEPGVDESLAESDDVFSELKAEVDAEIEDETSLESLQSDIDEAAFGEFDDDDDLSISELLEGPGEDDDWGDEGEVFDMDLGEPPEVVEDTDEEVESGFDGSGPFDADEPTDSGDVFAEMKAEVEDETTDEDALASLQADIEAAQFGEFDEDDDLSIGELLAGPEEDDDWEFDESELAADIEAATPTEADASATDEDLADALADVGEGLGEADAAEAPAEPAAAEAAADADVADAAADADVAEAAAEAEAAQADAATDAPEEAEAPSAPEPATPAGDLDSAVGASTGEVDVPAIEEPVAEPEPATADSADALEAAEAADGVEAAETTEAPEPLALDGDLSPAVAPWAGEPPQPPTVEGDVEPAPAVEAADAEAEVGPAAAEAAEETDAEPAEPAPSPATPAGDLASAVARSDLPDSLEEIPGVGSTKAQALRTAGFESVRAVRAADEDVIAEVPGFGDALASRIKEAVGDIARIPTPEEAEAETDAAAATDAVVDADADADAGVPADAETAVEDAVPAFDEFGEDDDDLDEDIEDLLEVDIPDETPATADAADDATEADAAADATADADAAADEAADADVAADAAADAGLEGAEAASDPAVEELLDVDIPGEEPIEAGAEADFSRDTETRAFEERFGHLFGDDEREGTGPVRTVNTIDDSSLDPEQYERTTATGRDDARSPLERVESITVDVDDADDLLTLAEQLTTTRFSLERSLPSELSDDALAALSNLQSATAGLRRTVMNVRLMPFERATQGLARTARDTARSQGKEVNFDVEGREVGLDRDIIERLRDPLVHLVRNAIDHGVEPPGERLEAGKPEAGKVTVRAEQVRDGVVVEVSDDGRGIDVEAVREQAVDAGLLDADEAEATPDDELYQYVFHAGFSTAPEVTDVSGRGVGMDVVDRVASDLDGSVTVDSAPGDGTTVRLTLPITVAVAEVVFVAVGDERYGVPMTAVESIESVEGVEVIDGEERLRTAGQATAATDGGVERDRGHDAEPARVIDLAARFGVEPDPDAPGKMVRIRPSVRNVALRCDEVEDTREVVIKPYEDVLGDLPGLSGATLLGNGELVNIIDVGTI